MNAAQGGGLPSLGDGDTDVMSISSEQVLGQRSFFNNTDLPAGFLFSPLSTPLGEIPHCAEPPPQCKTCGAFANKFSEYDHASTAWICNFCGCGNVHPGGLPPEAPFKQCEDFDFLPAATESALSSEQCWPELVSLVIDATLDHDLLEEVVAACKVLLHRLPETTLVTLLAFDSAVTIFELASPTQTPGLPGPVQSWVLPGDAQATPAMLQRLCAASSGLIAPVGVGLHNACAALDTLRPVHHTLKPRVRPRCIGAALAATHGVFDCYREAQLINVQSKASLRVLLMLGGPCTVGPGSAPVAVVDTGAARANPEDQFMLMEAQRFVEKLAGDMRSTGMIVDFISGGLNASNVPLWNRCVKKTGGTIVIQEGFGGLLPQSLIAMLHRHQAKSVSLDFFASDGLAIEQVIGPSVTTAPSATFQARDASVKGARRPASASSGGARGAVMGQAQQQQQQQRHRRSFSENWAGGLDGGHAGAPLDDPGGLRRSAQAACNAEGLEAGQAFAVVLKSGRDVEGRYAVVQAAARWCTPTGMWVMRVATRRLGVTTSYARYVASLQHATVTVLLAKCLILAAEKGAANGDVNFLEDSQARCASVLRGVARTVGVHKRNEGGRPGSARGLLGGLGGLLKSSLWGEENWKLQKELLPVAESLYSLHRGAMLGQVVGHADECAQLFHLFLKADLPLARAILVPRAYQVTVEAERQVVREMVACDLVLDSNTAVVLDCGTHIFLWLGANIDPPANLHAAIRQRSLAALGASTAGGTAAELLQSSHRPAASGVISACVQVAHACAVGRVPVPELKVCLEGTGDERYVLSRLAPTDSVARGDLVLAQLPHLVELYDEDDVYAAAMVAHITRRLPKTDEPGFVAWAAQAGVDLRAALLGEDSDKGSSGGVAPAKRGGAAAARPGSARGGPHTAAHPPANSTGDRADDLGIFSFLSRRPEHAREGAAGPSPDLEGGFIGADHMRPGAAAAPPLATVPPIAPNTHAGDAYRSGGAQGAGGPITFAGIVPPSSSAAPAPHIDSGGAGGGSNVHVQQPFRHSNAMHSHGAHAYVSPRSQAVPMPPRPPSLGSLPPGGRPGLSKPPLVPAAPPGGYMHPGYGKVASALSESASPHGRSEGGSHPANLRAIRGLQSPENPGMSRGLRMHVGVQQTTGAPTSHPPMQMPASFQRA